MDIKELGDEYYNCINFQFYTEKVFKDIPFFVILNQSVSTS